MCDRLSASQNLARASWSRSMTRCLKRRGRRVHSTSWHHDGTANSRCGSVAWANNWVCTGICISLALMKGTVCLPVLFRLWQPRRRLSVNAAKPDPGRPGKVKLASAPICLRGTRLGERQIEVVGDSAYISGAWRAQPKQVTITSRQVDVIPV